MFSIMPEEDDIASESINNITESTLSMRRYSDFFYGELLGTFSGLLGLLGIIFIYLVLFYNIKEFTINLFFSIVLSLVALIIIFIWRRTLPICFNRKTQTVSYWAHGVLFQKRWKDVRLYPKRVRRGRTTMFVLAFELEGGNKIKLEKTLYLDTDSKYIIEYMNYEEPKLHDETINYIKIANFEYKFSEIFKHLLPKKITLWVVLFSPYIAVEIMLYYLMFFLNEVLPKREIPLELYEACECKEEKREYGGVRKRIFQIGVLAIVTLFVSLGLSTSEEYYSTQSPNGEYRIYVSAYNYAIYTRSSPFIEYGDLRGKVYLYDNIEKKIINSASLSKIKFGKDVQWSKNRVSFKDKNLPVWKLPREISFKNLI